MFRLSEEVNSRAKLAIHHALAQREPYCVIKMLELPEDHPKKYRVAPYTGLAIDRKKVELVFFASARVEPAILRREGIIW